MKALGKIKAVVVGNRLIIPLSVVFLVFLVALFFFLRQSLLIDKAIKEEKPEEAIRQTDTEIPLRFPVELSGDGFMKKAPLLDTPEKLLTYLNENHLGEDARVVSFFGAQVLIFHNYETGILKYETTEGFINTVILVRDGDVPSYITLTNEGIKMFPSGWSFEDFFNIEEKRLNTKITRFAIFSNPTGIWGDFEWTER